MSRFPKVRRRQKSSLSRRLPAIARGPAIIGVITVVAIVGVLAYANLSQGKGVAPAVQELAVVGHDVPSTAAGSDIHFANTSVDLGTVPLHTEVGYAFSYANIGNQTLKIEDVRVRVLEGC
jgi:hypothetical protein